MMSEHYLREAILFLVDPCLGFYILIVLFRFLFQLTSAQVNNPISQFILKLSNPPLYIIQRVIPTTGSVNLAAILLLILLTSAQISVITLLTGNIPQLSGVVVLGIAKLLKLIIYVMIYSLFARAILSWFNTIRYKYLEILLYSFTEPILKRTRKFLPKTISIDISPIIVFIFLMLVMKLVVQPLTDLGNLIL
jgi:YggT family protein